MNKLLVLGMLVATLGAGCGSMPEPEANPSSAFAPEPPPPPPENVNFGNLFVMGKTILPNLETNEVTVDKAVFSKRGFVVFHAMDHGKTGAIVGKSDVQSVGEHGQILVPLTATLTPGAPYTAMLHADNGDNRFDPKKDVEHLKDASGTEIMVMFTAATPPPSDTATSTQHVTP
jgi:hypothetical protein